MTTTSSLRAMTFLVALAATGTAAAAEGAPSLEPCINGEVSATGLYPSQALEDAALGRATAGRVAAVAEGGVDPSVHSEVFYVPSTREDAGVEPAPSAGLAVR